VEETPEDLLATVLYHRLQRQPDITLAREKLGWEPTVPLREGLVHTIAYFDQLLTTGPAGLHADN
jgi:nucleoside-diphosphate-sugar epimerase